MSPISETQGPTKDPLNNLQFMNPVPGCLAGCNSQKANPFCTEDLLVLCNRKYYGFCAYCTNGIWDTECVDQLKNVDWGTFRCDKKMSILVSAGWSTQQAAWAFILYLFV